MKVEASRYLQNEALPSWQRQLADKVDTALRTYTLEELIQTITLVAGDIQREQPDTKREQELQILAEAVIKMLKRKVWRAPSGVAENNF